MSNGYAPRPLTDNEFILQFLGFVERLDAHIKLIDRGDYTFRNDMAAVLRVMLGRDRANNALHRFCKRFKLDMPTGQVSLEPTPRDGVVLAIGAMPYLELPWEDGPTVTMTEMLDRKCVLARLDTGWRRWSWREVIDDHGNSFGAHLSHTVPRLLEHMHFVGGGPTDIGTYMLRTIGVATSRAAHGVLGAIGFVHSSPPNFSGFFHEIEIEFIELIEKDKGHEVGARVRRPDWSRPGPLFSLFTPEGIHVTLYAKEGGGLSFTAHRHA